MITWRRLRSSPLSPSTPARRRRARTALALVCLVGASLTRADAPVEVPTVLDRPVALAAMATTQGGERLVVVDLGELRLVRLTLRGGTVVESRDLATDVPLLPTGVATLGERLLLVGPDGAASFDAAASEPSFTTLSSARLSGVPAVGPNTHYAIGEAGLLRGRVDSGRLGSYRLVDGDALSPAAVAFAPEGYLVTLSPSDAAQRGASGWRLRFLDPKKPHPPLSDLPLEGLSEPLAIAYSPTATPSARRLYVLDGGGAGDEGAGVFRVDAHTTDDGLPSAIAKRVATIEKPTAMAFTPSGALFVTARRSDNRGRLWRFPPGL